MQYVTLFKKVYFRYKFQFSNLFLVRRKKNYFQWATSSKTIRSREIFALLSGCHLRYIHKMQSFLKLKQMVHIVTTVL